MAPWCRERAPFRFPTGQTVAIAPAAAEDVRSGLPSAASLPTAARPISAAVPVMMMIFGMATPQGRELAPAAATPWRVRYLGRPNRR
jgi:hypothetical protein